MQIYLCVKFWTHSRNWKRTHGPRKDGSYMYTKAGR